MWRGNTYDNGYNVVCTGNQLSEMVNKLYIMFVMFVTSLFSIIEFDCFFQKKSYVFFLQEEKDLLLFIGKMLEGLLNTSLSLAPFCHFTAAYCVKDIDTLDGIQRKSTKLIPQLRYGA